MKEEHISQPAEFKRTSRRDELIGEDVPARTSLQVEKEAQEPDEYEEVLKRIRSEQERIQELNKADANFEDLIWRIERGINSVVRDLHIDLDRDVLAKKIDQEVNDEVRVVLEEVMSRIKNELSENPHYEAIEKVMPLLVAPHLSDSYVVEEEDSGVYYIKDKKISISDQVRTELEPYHVLNDLLIYGSSDAFSTLHHEYLHHTQNPKNLSEKVKRTILLLTDELIKVPYILDVFSNYASYRKKSNFRLHEAHSFFGSRRRTSESSLIRQHRSLTYYPELMQNKLDVDEIIVGINQVKQLYALDFSDEEIGKMIQTSLWDPVRLEYDTLANAIQGVMEQRGIEKEDVDNLVMLNDLKARAFVLGSTRITKEVIAEMHEKLNTEKNSAHWVHELRRLIKEMKE